jgi:SAM-dependent methyltransferase
MAETASREAELRAQYQLRFGSGEKYRDGVWKILCEDFFSRYVRPEAAVLDLGAGWGEFINNIAAGQKSAMDLNPETSRRLSPGIRHIQQDCSREWDVKSETLDVVFTSNFFEHLYDKSSVERTVREAHRCLRRSGLLICLGPNIKFVQGAYWDFWDHHVALTEMSLSELLRMNGFVIDTCIPRFLPYTMSTGRTPPLALVRLYLKLRPAWRIFGRQFLVVARKAGHEP